ncbi:MAG: PKD domain-containing protein [Candidatus Aminicenantes bacterium]|nr:PKD domain-containing protein [Candidatus Aminicenantes bacterium]
MKQKNQVFKGKVLFNFTLVFVLCCFMATSAWAAKKVDLLSANSAGYIMKMNNQGDHGRSTMGAIFGLTQGEKFTLLRQVTDFNSVTHARYLQTYKGIPIWGIQTVVSRDHTDEVVRINGAVVLDTPKDILNIPGTLDPKGALQRMQKQHKAKDANAVWSFRNEEYGTYIYIDKKNKAILTYVVSFFADNEVGHPSRYIYFIDVKSGKVIDSFNRLTNASGTGPGGNQKIGQYEYGTDYPAFGVAEAGGTCTMNFGNVNTVDLNHGTSGSTPYSYTCYRNTHETINGGYCPLNDGQFFGQVIYDMYQNWYGLPVLPFQLTMKLHYSTGYENAFWDGSSMTFGDGATTFYPLCCLDVSAHEVSHGFTENHSGLIYSSQSGGINEAFSDMAGEAAKYYMRGTNDFMCGYDIFKAAGQALRYLCNPPQDGISIDHISEYYEGLDVHYSSGLFNKVFCLVAQSPGWTTRMAFDIFVKANTNYWTPGTTFQQGAEGVISAAVDYGYNCQDVVNAFAVIGITVVCPGPPVANFTGTPVAGGIPLTVNFTDQSQAGTTYSWNFGDGGTSTLKNPSHTYTTIGTFTVTETVTNAFGSDTETKVNYITTTAPQPPIADFIASATDTYVNESVIFTDKSLENPTSWSWTFEGGTPAASTAQNPTVTYTTVGTYDVTLVVANAQGSDTETKLNYINVAEKPYCASMGSTYSMEWIAGVQVGSMNNASGAAGYTDFTNITCNLTGGTTPGVVLTPGFSGGVWTEYWTIWIDYNDDHDFDEAGESEFTGYGTSTVSGSFTVNPGIDKVTRMRVSMKYAAYPTSCETFAYGEVEDYTANVVSGTGNLPPVANFTFTTSYLTATFTDTSTDPDGSVVAWSWNFGDGGTSTLRDPVHTYAAAGTYNVTLTVTDNDGATNPITKPVTVTAPTLQMYVYDITQTITRLSGRYRSTAVVTIRNTNNAAVANARVYITWSGVVTGTKNAVTNSSGKVTFTSSRVRQTGPFTITVNNVTHATIPYNPALNVETSDTKSY